MSEVLMNVVTAAIFGMLAFGLLRRPLARWRARPQVHDAAGASVPAWVAVAAGVLILGLALLLANACFGPAVQGAGR
jgi:hypothetical protein